MRAVRYGEPKRWSLVELPDPSPAAGELVVDVGLCGVCGTDVHLDRGEFDPVYPLTPGHEIVGVVSGIGPPSTGRPGVLAVGDAVAVDNMTSCGTCRQCQRARPQFCQDMTALGVNRPGGFAERVVVPAGKCHPIGSLSHEIGVFAEPLACVVHGLDVLRPPQGADVLVAGLGPTGLLLTQLLRQAGSSRVTVVGRRAVKLELAAAYGADHAVALDGDGWPGAHERLRRLAPDGFDVVVDATGSEDVLKALTRELAIGGTLFVYGMTAETAALEIDPYDVFRRELTIRGSFSQAFSVGRAVDLLRNGRVRVEEMISRRFPLGAYGDALAAATGDPDCIKAVIAP